MGKGEIARYEQFLLFPKCFQKVCFPEASKGVIVWEWVNSLPNHKMLDLSKLRSFADTKLLWSKVLTVLLRMKEKEKMPTTGISSFSCIFKHFVRDFLKLRIVWERIK